MLKDLVPLYSILDSIFDASEFSYFFNQHQYSFSTFLERFKFPEFKSSVNYPKSNCYITENSINLEIAVTGFSKEEIEIKRKGNDITIKTNKPENIENRGYICQELARRNFSVTYRLSSNKFDYNKIKTKLENGILYIEIPIKEKAEPDIQKIEIK